jgi:hypothetical protein
MNETIKPQPLSPEQREEIEKRHGLDSDLLAPFWPEERPKYYTDREALLSHIAYLEEQIKGAVLVPVEVANRMERWAMKASFEYAGDAQVLPEANAEKARESARQANADAQTIAAALSKTPSGGK